MSLPLLGKVAIVTGASRGIGASVAGRLAADGATVVVNYNNSKEAADALVGRINAEGKGKAVAVKADVSLPTEGNKLVEDTFNQFGKLDILVLNAALVINGTLDSINEEQFDSQFTVNVKVPLLMVQTASKYLKAGECANADAKIDYSPVHHGRRSSHILFLFPNKGIARATPVSIIRRIKGSD